MMEENPFLLCPDCINDRSKLKGVLSDIFPTERLKVNIILYAFDGGIIDILKNAKSIDNIVVSRIIKYLTSEYGISTESAEYSANYWIDNYGIRILGKTRKYADNSNISSASSTPVPFPLTKSQINRPISTKGHIPLKVDSLKEGEKLPSWVIEYDNTQESQFGIKILRCTIFVRSNPSKLGFINLKITGEYSGKISQSIPSKNMVILFLAYNANGNLIGVNFGEKIYENSDSTHAFTQVVWFPNDETLSKIAVKFIPDPNSIVKKQ